MRYVMNKSSIGFLTFAQNTDDVDYLKLAYVQALNVKSLHPTFGYAVVVDSKTAKSVTEKHKKVFDYVIELTEEQSAAPVFANEFRVFRLSPFKETIKLESDLLFTRSILHWMPAFRLKNIVLSYGCKNYKQTPGTSRLHRKFFDDNLLPDLYNGLMYFRYSVEAQYFFQLAESILTNWEHLKNNVLKNCRENSPSTDVLYALTAQVYGIENCTVPTMDFINFVHMKSHMQNWSDDRLWTDIVNNNFDEGMIRINNLNQYHPIHYYDKKFITDEVIEYYERIYRS